MVVHPEPLLHLALLQPEIPGNTGNIGRLAVGLGARLHLVHPLGFSTDEKAVRRAGIDHWRKVDLQEHPDDDAFFAWAKGRRLLLFSARGEHPFTDILWARGDVLVFGRESVGLSEPLVQQHGAWRIPMPGPIRSLNLSNAAAVVAYTALQRLRPELFGG